VFHRQRLDLIYIRMRGGMAAIEHVPHQACFGTAVVGHIEFQAKIAPDENQSTELAIVSNRPREAGQDQAHGEACSKSRPAKGLSPGDEQVGSPGYAEQ
jgi:hypothetical protein